MFDKFKDRNRWKLLFKFFYLLLLPINLICIFFLFQKNTTDSQIYSIPNNSTLIDPVVVDPRYITCTYQDPEGLGNQLYRFISLYGIGKQIGRLPYIDATNAAQMALMPNISRAFPRLHEILNFKTPPSEVVKTVKFADDCCKFENPTNLTIYSEKYLQLSAKYLQAFPYFHTFKDEVRKIMECSPQIQEIVDGWTEKLFGNDDNHKFCVHIRRGDFFKTGMLVSKKETIYPMMKFAYGYLMEATSSKNISIVYLGQDYDFIRNLSTKSMGFQHEYRVENHPREEDMCFAIKYCDSLLMTASGSTFSWWIAYLMKSTASIFYNSQVTRYADFSKDFYDYDTFLPKWIKLTVKNGFAIREDKWWYQRHNKNV